MADDVTIGSGAVVPVDVLVAADEVAGKKIQRVKVQHGADGSATDASTAAPFPVDDDATQTLLAALIALLPAALAANGGLKIEGVAGGVSVPISGSITASGTFPSDSSKVEDAAHASGDTGTFVLAVRNDAGTALAGTTGDYIPLSTDSSGNLRTTGGGGGTQFAEDAAHASGDLGTMALAVRKDTATALAGTDGDYTPLITDANGRQHVNVGVLPALPAGTANIGDVDLVGPSASTGAVTAFTGTSSTTIWSANASSKLRTFANDSDKDLFLMMRAAAASTTAYHVKVPANGGFFSTDYTGELRGILSGTIVTGQVNCGEFT